MGDEKLPISMNRDRELLIPISNTNDNDDDHQLSSSSFSHHPGREFWELPPRWPSGHAYLNLTRKNQGLGFVTSVTFIFVVGIFMSSWLGASVLSLGEWFIKRMPFVRHIYDASKQISAAISPDQNSRAFQEVVIIKHPRAGEYAFGFITSSFILQSYTGEEELYSVYVPTNHLYIGDIFLVNSKEVIRPNLSVREGIGKNCGIGGHVDATAANDI
ncbi:COV 1-like protein [Tanacetum coccineum]